MVNQISKSISGKVYSYNSRYSSIKDARKKAISLNGSQHCYYTKVQVKGELFYDVRTEN